MDEPNGSKNYDNETFQLMGNSIFGGEVFHFWSLGQICFQAFPGAWPTPSAQDVMLAIHISAKLSNIHLHV